MKNQMHSLQPIAFAIGDVVVLKSDEMVEQNKKTIEDILDNTAYLVFTDKNGTIQRNNVQLAALLHYVAGEESKKEV